MKDIKKCLVLFIVAVLAMLSACASTENAAPTQSALEAMNMDVVPEIGGMSGYEMPEAEASGVLLEKNEKVVLDWSNTADGYVMLRYLGTNGKVKVIITGPSGTGYTYNMSLTGEYDVFPLSDGSGNYSANVYENTSENTSGNKYSIAFSYNFDVELNNEFEPFLRPNKYVSFTADSSSAVQAAKLTAGCADTLEMIKAIYEFTVANISYDYELAETVQSGYIPDVDAVLTRGKGICFDYAALMTAMLRSQGIPTKLVVGYTGDLYHAWINTYSEESGWVEASIFFDGTQWKLMDPTFAASADSDKEIMKYIGNGVNYSAKYIY